MGQRERLTTGLMCGKRKREREITGIQRKVKRNMDDWSEGERDIEVKMVERNGENERKSIEIGGTVVEIWAKGGEQKTTYLDTLIRERERRIRKWIAG